MHLLFYWWLCPTTWFCCHCITHTRAVSSVKILYSITISAKAASTAITAKYIAALDPTKKSIMMLSIVANCSCALICRSRWLPCAKNVTANTICIKKDYFPRATFGVNRLCPAKYYENSKNPPHDLWLGRFVQFYLWKFRYKSFWARLWFKNADKIQFNSTHLPWNTIIEMQMKFIAACSAHFIRKWCICAVWTFLKFYHLVP